MGGRGLRVAWLKDNKFSTPIRADVEILTELYKIKTREFLVSTVVCRLKQLFRKVEWCIEQRSHD